MTPIAAGLIGIAILFVLLILRTPVAFAMLSVGFFGYWALEGARSAGGVLLTESYSAVANYNLIVVPMFVLLGNIASAAGFSRGLYDAAFAWVGAFRGGLASALNEMAEAAGVTVEIEESALPLRAEVKGMCEILGLDPLYLANEGTLVAFVPEDQAEAALAAMRATGPDAVPS
jgi:hydrogenase maturation factor HypE